MERVRIKRYDCWTVVRESEISGVWTAHCLLFDLVAQGNSPEDAVLGLWDSMAMVVEEDLNNGLEPADRIAPLSYWDEFDALFAKSVSMSKEEVAAAAKSGDGSVFVVSLTIAVTGEETKSQTPRVPLYLIAQAQSETRV